MKPPTLLRKTLLLLCGVACVLACEANAQNALPPTARADESCELGAPSTIPCVQKYLITNDQLRGAVSFNSLPNHFEKIISEQPAADSATGSAAYKGAKKRLDGIVQYAAEQSAEMVISTPDMYVGMLPTQAQQTREGKPFVLVNKNAFKMAILTDEGAATLKLALSREFAHIRNGDTAPSAIAHHRNEPASSREAELRADLEGAGPLGLRCQPDPPPPSPLSPPKLLSPQPLTVQIQLALGGNFNWNQYLTNAAYAQSVANSASGQSTRPRWCDSKVRCPGWLSGTLWKLSKVLHDGGTG